jgi:hypothetical protein
LAALGGSNCIFLSLATVSAMRASSFVGARLFLYASVPFVRCARNFLGADDFAAVALAGLTCGMGLSMPGFNPRGLPTVPLTPPLAFTFTVAR